MEHLRGGRAAEGGFDDLLDIGYGQPVTRNRRAIHGDLHLGLAQQLLGAHVGGAGDFVEDARDLFRERL